MAESRDWRRGALLGKGATGWIHLAAPTNPRAPRFKNAPSYMAVRSSFGPFKALLENERSLLAMFRDCPHIVRYFGHEETMDPFGNHFLYVFVELAMGGSLVELKFPLEEGLVRRHTRSILLGLKRIHDAGYVHCSLKPSSILLVRKRSCKRSHNHKDGRRCCMAKVANLGRTRAVGEGCMIQTMLPEAATYLSPEAARLRIQDRPSDVWALGCMVLQMFGGTLPWHSVDFSVDYIKKNIAADLLVFPHGLSKDAVDFLSKCFKENPRRRATVDELLQHPLIDGLEPEEEEEKENNEEENDGEENDEQEKTPATWWAKLWFAGSNNVIQRCASACDDMLSCLGLDNSFFSPPPR